MNQDTLKQLTTLCAQLALAQREEEDAERVLKEKKEAVRRLEEDDIPSLMTELNVSKIQLETGENISVANVVYAEFSKKDSETKRRAFDWLKEKGHDGIIKTEVSVAFDKGDISKAKALQENLAEQGLTSVLDQNIHASTLKAFIKERLEAGEECPLDMFGARSVNKAKVK